MYFLYVYDTKCCHQMSSGIIKCRKRYSVNRFSFSYCMVYTFGLHSHNM